MKTFDCVNKIDYKHDNFESEKLYLLNGDKETNWKNVHTLLRKLGYTKDEMPGEYVYAKFFNPNGEVYTVRDNDNGDWFPEYEGHDIKSVSKKFWNSNKKHAFKLYKEQAVYTRPEVMVAEFDEPNSYMYHSYLACECSQVTRWFTHRINILVDNNHVIDVNRFIKKTHGYTEQSKVVAREMKIIDQEYDFHEFNTKYLDLVDKIKPEKQYAPEQLAILFGLMLHVPAIKAQFAVLERLGVPDFNQSWIDQDFNYYYGHLWYDLLYKEAMQGDAEARAWYIHNLTPVNARDMGQSEFDVYDRAKSPTTIIDESTCDLFWRRLFLYMSNSISRQMQNLDLANYTPDEQEILREGIKIASKIDWDKLRDYWQNEVLLDITYNQKHSENMPKRQEELLSESANQMVAWNESHF